MVSRTVAGFEGNVTIAHRLATIRSFDQASDRDGGCIVAVGTFAEVSELAPLEKDI